MELSLGYGLSVEELADYIADNAEAWDGLDPRAVNVNEVYAALHEGETEDQAL